MQPQRRLIDLEHQRLKDWRNLDNLSPKKVGGWQQAAWWLTGLPQNLMRFRAGTGQDKELCYRYDAVDEELGFYERNEGSYNECTSKYNLKRYQRMEHGIDEEYFWLPRDYLASLRVQASRNMIGEDESEGEILQRLSERYGQLTIRGDDCSGKSYWYDDQFGAFHLLF